jgi:hypothetical protein
VARNIALKAESRRRPTSLDPVDAAGIESDEESLSRIVDRAWAEMIVHEAAEVMREAAAKRGGDALMRVDLLRLRFAEGLPIRDVAVRWNEDPKAVHRHYARAREEFAVALKEVLARHHPGPPAEIEREVARLRELLS